MNVPHSGNANGTSVCLDHEPPIDLSPGDPAVIRATPAYPRDSYD
jgi:hypothetical protein